MSKPTKTRAIRLSDEAWNELKRRADEYNLRGRAEYLEMLCKEDKDKPEETIEWDSAKGWWKGNKLDQYRPDDATLESVGKAMNDAILKGIDEAFFGKNPIKPHSFAFEIAAYDANSRPTLMDKHVQARVEAEALELENKIVQSGGNLSDTTLVFCADTYSVEKSLQDIAEYVERDT